jgi:hypothetical protein
MSGAGPMILLDGISRLDALEAIGCEFAIADGGDLLHIYPDEEQVDFLNIVAYLKDEAETVALINSLNEHRRHSPLESREATQARIEALLKASPTKSDRQIAEEARVSHPRVGKIRQKAEARGDVERRSTSTETKGRKQPRQRMTKRKESEPKPPAEQQSAGRRAAQQEKPIEEVRAEYAALEEADASAAGGDTHQATSPAEAPAAETSASTTSAPAELQTAVAKSAESRVPEAPVEPTIEGAEAEVRRLKELKAAIKTNSENDKIDAGAAAYALAEFRAACVKWLPQMNEDGLQKPIDTFAEVVEVPANELIPSLTILQIDLKLAKAEITVLSASSQVNSRRVKVARAVGCVSLRKPIPLLVS